MLRELCVIAIADGWAIRRQGELKLMATFDSQQQALHAALRQAWDDQVDVLVQQSGGGWLRQKPAQPPEPPKKSRRAQRSSQR